MNTEVVETLVMRGHHEICSKYGILVTQDVRDEIRNGQSISCMDVFLNLDYEFKRTVRAMAWSIVGAHQAFLMTVLFTARYSETGAQFIFGLIAVFLGALAFRFWRLMIRLRRRPPLAFIEAEIMNRISQLFFERGHLVMWVPRDGRLVLVIP